LGSCWWDRGKTLTPVKLLTLIISGIILLTGMILTSVLHGNTQIKYITVIWCYVCIRFYIPPWSYGSWIYNYLCNQCPSPLMLWVPISIRARCTTLCDKICQWLATGWWLSPGTQVSSTNKTDCHDITEILLKVALNTIKQTNKQDKLSYFYETNGFV
jgi:hypothetical protein